MSSKTKRNPYKPMKMTKLSTKTKNEVSEFLRSRNHAVVPRWPIPSITAAMQSGLSELGFGVPEEKIRMIWQRIMSVVPSFKDQKLN